MSGELLDDTLEELHRSQSHALRMLNKYPGSAYWKRQVCWLGTEIRIHPMSQRNDYSRARRRINRAKEIYTPK